jgi:hypothetical protein
VTPTEEPWHVNGCTTGEKGKLRRSVNDSEGNIVAIVWGRSFKEIDERADIIAHAPAARALNAELIAERDKDKAWGFEQQRQAQEARALNAELTKERDDRAADAAYAIADGVRLARERDEAKALNAELLKALKKIFESGPCLEGSPIGAMLDWRLRGWDGVNQATKDYVNGVLREIEDLIVRAEKDGRE